MADAVVINKADGDNLTVAEKAKSSYQNALHLFSPDEKNWSPPVLLASSISGFGMNQIWEQIELYESKMKKNGFWNTNRAGQRLNWLEDQTQFLLGQRFLNHPQVKTLLEKEKQNVRSGKLNPRTLAKNLIEVFLSNPSKT